MADTQNKRKFDDTGSGSVSYNRVPPPLSDFESAKQKALQIAARLSASQDQTKRSRFEDRPSDDTASHGDPSVNETHYSSQVSQVKSLEKPYTDASSSSFYSMQGAPESKKLEIPNIKVGLVIGKGGETIKYIQQQSGARIQITRDMDHNPNLPFRTVELMGTSEQINRAEQLIHDVIAEADAAATNPTHPSGGEQVQMNIPTNKVGLIIGRGGETIKSLQSRTGARIQLVPLLGPPEYHSGVAERTLSLVGSKEQIDTATDLIKELLSENRVRASPIQGVYNQPYNPQGSQPWGPPGGPPIHQQGYGYQQGYPQAFQQGSYYPGPPQHYGNYPQQTWNQLPPAPPPQYHPSGGYDYYNQQGQMGYTQQAQGVSYEQPSYAEQPPGAPSNASQEGYGQPESYRQVDSHQTYGPPGTSPYGHQSFTQGPPQESYEALGAGEQGYGQQEQPGVGQPDYGYQQQAQEPQGQGDQYSYGRTNGTNYEQQEPSPSVYGQATEKVSSEVNYGKSGAGYWNNVTGQYNYSETNYEQAPKKSGYGNQQGGPSETERGYPPDQASTQESNGCVNGEEPPSSYDYRLSYNQYNSGYNHARNEGNGEDEQPSAKTQADDPNEDEER